MTIVDITQFRLNKTTPKEMSFVQYVVASPRSSPLNIAALYTRSARTSISCLSLGYLMGVVGVKSEQCTNRQ